MPRTNIPGRIAVYRSHFRAGRCLPRGDVLGPSRCSIKTQPEETEKRSIYLSFPLFSPVQNHSNRF